MAVYVNDMNLIDTPEEIKETAKHLKLEFEMKGLGRTNYCLDLEPEHSADEILVHQPNYIQKMLRCFNENKSKHTHGRLKSRENRIVL